jgi:hypothetical protein
MEHLPQAQSLLAEPYKINISMTLILFPFLSPVKILTIKGAKVGGMVQDVSNRAFAFLPH